MLHLLLTLALSLAAASAAPANAARGAYYDCTGADNVRLCSQPVSYPNLTFPGSSGNDWWQQSGNAAIAWSWDERNPDEQILFVLREHPSPNRTVSSQPPPLTGLLDASAAASKRGAVFPLKYALPGAEVAPGTYRVVLVRPLGPANCTTVAGVLADAHAGGANCFFTPTTSVWGLVEVRTSGGDMPEIAAIGNGTYNPPPFEAAAALAEPSSGSSAARAVPGMCGASGLLAALAFSALLAVL